MTSGPHHCLSLIVGVDPEIVSAFRVKSWCVSVPPLDLLVITLRKTFQRGFRFSITWPSQLDTLRPDTRLAGRCVTWTPMERPFVRGANDMLLSVCQSVDSWLGCPSWRRHPVPVPGGPQVNSWTSILVTNTSDKDLMPVNLKLYVCVCVLVFCTSACTGMSRGLSGPTFQNRTAILLELHELQAETSICPGTRWDCSYQVT